MIEFPLQLVDDILLDYHIAHVLLLVFILALPVGFVKGSMKITGLQFIAFGLIFVLTPPQTHPMVFQFFGMALVVVGPLFVIVARE